jgi:GTP-binding protein
MFIDEAKIHVEGGGGGNGCIAFRREKYVPKGGPSGGDGGDGGSVILRVGRSTSTLNAFRYKQHFRAQRGAHGEGSNRHGRNGEDLVVDVPAGTVVLDDDRTLQLAELLEEGQTWVAARGGRGGRGNARFKSSVNQAPRIAQDGEPGEARWIRMELKLLADVGLVGFPNAGKSSLLARVSAARPRVADYPFTTLHPVLGVVETDGHQTFLMADIPGLLEGAHAGHGLGTRFLRHVERTRVLVHVVDLSPDSGRDPVQDLEVIEEEIRQYSEDLSLRPCLLAFNKMDLKPPQELLERLRRRADEKRLPWFEISTVTGAGLEELVRCAFRTLQQVDAEGTTGAGEA